MPNGETELTRTLTERDPLVRLNRVEMQLRLERHLAELRQDRMWQKSCHDALKRLYGIKSMIVRRRQKR